MNEKIWENIRFIIVSERGQYEKAKYCMMLTVWYLEKNKTMLMIKRSVVAKDGKASK